MLANQMSPCRWRRRPAHAFNSACQLTITCNPEPSRLLVSTRNLCPSALTSYSSYSKDREGDDGGRRRTLHILLGAILCQQRLHLVAQLFIAPAGLGQEGSALTSWPLPGRMIQLLD